MNEFRGDVWLDLPNNHCVSIGRPRRKRGRTLPARWLVLGPLQPGRFLRRSVAAGDVVCGRPIVTHGALSDELLAALATALATALDGSSHG